MATHIFGIRHHGPGSAKHMVQALEAVTPDIILLEGPPEAEGILKWAAHEAMQPPVAILAYVPDDPYNAVFYPFTSYSPEWQAILYGLKHNIPIRFIDMPLVYKLAAAKPTAGEPDEDEDVSTLAEMPVHPMNPLAQIAGYDDEEEWWEQHFELSQEEPLLMFETIKGAIAALRENRPETERMGDLQREVFMRRAIQTAQNEMYDTIAVVCGAWHAPALEQKFTQKQEKELLKNLGKTKVECTWIPWTNDRLMFESGYGAGIISPGWYEHRWNHPDDDGTLWLTKTARVFREQRIDISSAHVIEAAKLVNALAMLRGRPMPGLKEFTEATQTVMCMGAAAPLALLKSGLIVGNRIGAIPPDAPQSPLQTDFEKQLKSLRLKITEGEQAVVLDLRKPLDLQKSIFLHRLQILGINWGSKEGVSSKGTFKEQWGLYWKPEMLIDLIAKSPMGNTIEQAAGHYLEEIVGQETELKSVSAWLQLAIPAELDGATTALLEKMDTLAASASDIEALIGSLFPLSEIMKYGNVRRSDKAKIEEIFTTIFSRALVGLPAGCLGINPEQAADISVQIKKLHKVVRVLDDDGYTSGWYTTLETMSRNEMIAPFVSGTVNKLVYESAILPPEATAMAFSRALSQGADVSESAQWLEGFLNDAATVLLLDEGIWGIVYNWVSELEEEHFIGLLPVLRRTFSEYTSPEKQKIAHKVKRGNPIAVFQPEKTGLEGEMVTERALPLVSTIEYLLGL